MTDAAKAIEQAALRLGHALSAQHLVLATAESCTAGGLAYAVTLVPGSSRWFDRGYVTYSNEAKTQMLGVSVAYLRDYGAVSEPVARAMALGALAPGSAQVALAVTGIAGPDGGSAEKPVGTVCFAWGMRRGPVPPWVRTETRRFEGDRAAVRTQSIIFALETMAQILQPVAAPPDA
jgi:nicotinamide-nucleotide amidase